MSIEKDAFKQAGLSWDDYDVSVILVGETNQVVVINDIVNNRGIRVPVEVDTRKWSSEQFAQEVIEMIEIANKNSR